MPGLNLHARIGRVVCQREIAGISQLREIGATLGVLVAGR